jgi:transcriptional repressor NrdR
MKCPFCSHTDTQVVETRVAEDGDLHRAAAANARGAKNASPPTSGLKRAFQAIVKEDGRRIEYERTKLLGPA